jgi:hypothetical protein
MKNKILISIIFIVLITSNAQAQTVRRVSNALGAGAPYTTIQDAINAAVDGDIILVEGSPTTYTGAISLTKRVTIQGPGYFLDQNTGLQANSNTAVLGTISFDAGSAGSVVRGIRTSGITINASNITFSNNYIIGGLTIAAAVNNIVISGNYFLFLSASFRVNANVTSLLISNNYMGIGFIFDPSVTVLAVVTNNVIVPQNNLIQNSTITNNIFLTAATPITDAFNSTIQNNVFVSTAQTGADASNIFGATTAALFVGLTGNTTDTQWKLKAGSPAIGAGAGGTDCGMYGGNTPYKISGVFTGQPTISNFTTPGTVPANGTLNVKVSAKVN